MYIYVCNLRVMRTKREASVADALARCALIHALLHTDTLILRMLIWRWNEEVFNWRGRGGCVKKKILNTNFHNMKKKYRYTNFAYVHLKVEGWLCSDTRQIPQCFTTFSNGMALMIVRRWYAHGSLRERACVCVVLCVCVWVYLCKIARRLCAYGSSSSSSVRVCLCKQKNLRLPVRVCIQAGVYVWMHTRVYVWMHTR